MTPQEDVFDAIKKDNNMNIYLVTRKDECDYDEYDEFVVIAVSEEDARLTHPDPMGYCEIHDTWTTPDNVTVENLGKSSETTKRIVISSFNAS